MSMPQPAKVSVVVPVRDGARYLREVLDAIARQRIASEVETLVVDSGSRDDSPAIARAAGARVIEIAPQEFGHGRTRNFAVEQASGACVAFLTQDATPASEHWLASLVAPLDCDARIGLSFGPHLPRVGTSPMIARELDEFFGSFSDGDIRIDDRADPADPASGFFSNVNSCVLRECWDETRFRDVGYAEDQALARDAFEAGWKKAYVPAAAVLHAHDYPLTEFMRRYFDEYRGLRETIGHVEPIGLGRLTTTTRAQLKGDLAYMRKAGYGTGPRAAWAVRSVAHHGGRGLFSALGSRAERLPAPVRRRLSLERRDGAPAGSLGMHVAAKSRPQSDYIREYSRDGVAALDPPSPHDAERPLLHLAWLIPPFRRGSGGHMALFRIALELERRGHSNSIWIHDPLGLMDRRVALAHREIVEHFAPLRAGVFRGFDDWHGADVALATGWQTAYPLARMERCKLKTYLVQDFEPDFYPASAERIWAEQTYRMGYPCLASSPWLANLMHERYGAQAETFEYGVDLDVYRPRGGSRDRETVLFYARTATPRRATELGILALAELVERRPGLRVIVFGDHTPPAMPFDYEFAGIQPPESLAGLYSRATVGLVLSLTNYSLIPKEMMACGLPVVDVQGASAESVFGSRGEAIELAEPDPLAIAGRIAALLDDPPRRAQLSAGGERLVAGMTWNTTAETIERHLRGWLSERWRESLRAHGGPSRGAEAGALARTPSHLA